MSQLSFEALHDYGDSFRLQISFETEYPVTFLFGPSGSGKTTVLEMIAGLRRPHKGRIRFRDALLLDTEKGLNVKPQSRGVGMVFQDQALFPHFTVERNLRYGEQRRRSKKRAVSFDRVVDVLEVGPLLSRYPVALSGGERQRIALGRALLSQPRLLLLDEPMAGLDDSLKEKVTVYIQRVVDEWHLPTLIVSHSRLEVERLGDWVVELREGRVVRSLEAIPFLGTYGGGGSLRRPF